MSISDGLGLSIFCRKMEKTRPMREEMDGKVVFFPARFGIFTFDVILLDSTVPNLYLDLACKRICFTPEKGINRRNESTTGVHLGTLQHSSELLRTLQNLLRAFSELVYNYYWLIVLTIINQSLFIYFIFQYWNCKPPIWLSHKKDNQLLIIENAFPVEMATRNKKKLAALNKKNCEEHPRSNLARNPNVPRSQEDYLTQISEEIEGRVTKKLSHEFSRTENRILGALAWLDDFLMNPLFQGHSGTTPETPRNVFSINQRTNEDDSQSNPHPEAGLFNNQTTQNSGQEDRHDMAIGVQRMYAATTNTFEGFDSKFHN